MEGSDPGIRRDKEPEEDVRVRIGDEGVRGEPESPGTHFGSFT